MLAVDWLSQVLRWGLISGSSHLIGKINFLFAVRLLFNLPFLGQLIQRLHHRLAEGRVEQ